MNSSQWLACAICLSMVWCFLLLVYLSALFVSSKLGCCLDSHSHFYLLGINLTLLRTLVLSILVSDASLKKLVVFLMNLTFFTFDIPSRHRTPLLTSASIFIVPSSHTSRSSNSPARLRMSLVSLSRLQCSVQYV